MFYFDLLYYLSVTCDFLFASVSIFDTTSSLTNEHNTYYTLGMKHSTHSANLGLRQLYYYCIHLKAMINDRNRKKILNEELLYSILSYNF